MPAPFRSRPHRATRTTFLCAVLLIALIVFALAPTSSSADGIPRTTQGYELLDAPIVDGTVDAVVIHDGLAYVGGNFGMIGSPTGPAAEIDLKTGELTSTLPEIRGGGVTAVAADGAGGWYLAGYFTEVGGQARAGLARVLADGSVDPGFDPGVDGSVDGMVLEGGVLYVAGSFSTLGGAARENLGALDAATGVPTAWAPEADRFVSAIAIGPGGILVGGRFDNVGGAARNRFAELDPTTGDATSLTVDVAGATNRSVRAIAVDGSTAFLGGGFTSVAGEAREHLAAVDLGTGAATSWNPSPDDHVESLATLDGTLYVGGRFTTLAGSPRTFAGSFDLGTGALNAWDPALGLDEFGFGAVWSLAAAGDSVVLGGSFGSVAGVERRHLVQVDATTAAATGFTGSAGKQVDVVAIDGTLCVVGGGFGSVGGVLRSHLAAFDLATGLPTEWAPRTSRRVSTMALSGSTLYLGGEFLTVEDQPRAHLAAVDADTGALLPWDPSADGDVHDLGFASGSVLLGGGFGQVGGQVRSSLAEVDAVTGAVTGWAPMASGTVLALDASADTVYVGLDGDDSAEAFELASGASTGWAPVDPGYAVGAVTVDGGDVLLGGDFGELGGQSRSYLGAVDAVTGAATSWNPGADGGVTDFLVDGDQVFAAGWFTSLGSARGGSLIPRTGIGAVDRTTGAPTWTPDTVGSGRAVAVSGAFVVVGGDFGHEEGMGRGGLLIFSNAAWIFGDGFEGGDVEAWSASGR